MAAVSTGASPDVPAASVADRTAGSEPASTAERLALVAIVLAAIAVRLPSLGNSLFGDELSSYFIVTQHSLGGIVRLLDGHSVDLTPPLYFLLARLVLHLGNTALALTAVPMIAGTVAVPMTYVLGAQTVGRRAGLVAAGIMALSPFLIFYSTEARAYALVMALVLGSTLCLLRALDSARWPWWTGYGVLTCAAMYTHYTAVFLLAVQFVWALAVHPARRRALLTATAAAAVGFAPWIPALIKNSHSFGTRVFGILEPFTAAAVRHDIEHWAIGHPYLALSTVPGMVAVAAVVVGLVIAAIALVTDEARARPKRLGAALRAPGALPLLLALATPVGLVLYSLVRVDTWDMRNLISSWPGLAVSAGWLIAAHPRARWVALGFAGFGFAVAGIQMLPRGHERPDYAGVARFVLANGSRTDPVAVITAPTPGPLSAMDAAFAYAGDANRPLLRVGSPSLQATLAAPPYALLPATPTAALATEAERVRPGERLYVIAPGTVPLASLLNSGHPNPETALGPSFGGGPSGAIFASVYVPLSAFLRAVAPDFAAVQTRVFPGILEISVYVLRRR